VYLIALIDSYERLFFYLTQSITRYCQKFYEKKKKNGTTEDTEGKLIKKLCELFNFLNQKVFSLKRMPSVRKKIGISA